MDPLTDLRRFLELQRDVREAGGPRRPEWRHASIEGLLLTHGRACAPAVKPARIPWGEPKACFANAFGRRLKQIHDERLVPTGRCECKEA